MNLLAKAKLSAHLIRKRPLFLNPFTALQQCNSYSSKTAYNTKRTQQFTKPRTQKPSEPSPTISQRSEIQTGTSTVWPEPKEIPYQSKVANTVNLIGRIKNPVQFEADTDGKYFAATVISQEITGQNNPLLIPVVFEGDLAHVVSCHVKENDCVLVSGRLCVGPLRFVFSESLGKFHVVAENLNFVEGFKGSSPSKRIGVPFSGVEIDKLGEKKIEEVVKRVDSNEEEFVKGKSFTGLKNEWASSISAENFVKPSVNVDADGKQEMGNGMSRESGNKKKNGDLILDLWRDLVKNPLQWWDYRGHKSNGLVKEKHPDFKQKVTGEGLWLDSAPNWVLPGFEKLEFDVKDVNKAKQVQVVEGVGEKREVKGEDLWKSLVENPNKWWDNRLDKRNPRAPDFKHKDTGEGLWVDNRTPDWALSRLPPSKVGQNAV